MGTGFMVYVVNGASGVESQELVCSTCYKETEEEPWAGAET